MSEKGRPFHGSAPRLESVNASEASKRDAAGIMDMRSLKSAIQDVVNERAALASRKRQLETRLVEIVGMFRGGTIFPRDQYMAICSEQNAVRLEVKALDDALFKNKQQRMALEKDAIDLEPRGSGKYQDRDKLLEMILGELVSIRKLITQHMETNE